MRSKSIIAVMLAAVISVGYTALPVQVSPAVSVSAAAKLAAPSGISYTAGTDTVTIKWDALSGADAYRVYASSDDIDTTDDTKHIMIGDDMYFVYKTVKAPKCRIEGLRKGKNYHFIVAALDKNGGKYIEGTRSGVIKAKTKTAVPPKAPSAGYTGTATSGGKTYYFKDGKVAKGFIKTSAGYMYFDPETYEMKKGFVTAGNATYYFGSDGIMLAGGTYKIGGTTYEFGADGKAMLKTTPTKSSPSYTRKTNSRGYPNLYYYGFDDLSDYAKEHGYDFDDCGSAYDVYDETNGTYSAIDQYFEYIQAWKDMGYTVETDEMTSEGDYLMGHSVIYRGDDMVAVAVMSIDINTELSMVTVRYYM
ncbi:MAG: hypothetical protein IKR73_04535 [Oscillospiraceae bacterium]|nr:hypothetical protein [Oscillospiraceae bacterium]